MADWNLPTLTSTYTNVLNNLKDRDVDAATQFYAAAPTNPATNTIRWVDASKRWERWNGSAWVVLSTAYSLALGTGSTIDNTPIGGTTRSTGYFTTGSFSGSASPASGASVELTYGAIASSGRVMAYDRTGSAYRDMIVDGLSVDLRVSGTSKLKVDTNGVGVGAAPEAASTALLTSTTQTGTTQNALRINVTGTTSGTAALTGVRSALSTPASAYTVTDVVHFVAASTTKGSGSTITNNTAFSAPDTSSGTNNFGFVSALTSGTGKWNLYASGTAANYMAGDLRIGTTTQNGSNKLTVVGGGAVDTLSVSTSATIANISASDTSAVKLSVGTTAQRPTGVQGHIRYNTTLNQFEGYNGTDWGKVGGGATGGGSDDIFIENGKTVTTSYTITTNKNAMTAGPITIADGVTVTVPDGSVWTIV